jgi:hypothetical protein
MFILIGPHVRHFSDGNQRVCPTLKNKSWAPIMPKQRGRCLSCMYSRINGIVFSVKIKKRLQRYLHNPNNKAYYLTNEHKLKSKNKIV